MTCYVYMLQCSDGSFYVGCTLNVQERVQAHQDGRGPVFTACRRPVRLVYQEACASMADARKREIQIKKGARAKKQALMCGDADRLKDLSRCQGARKQAS